MISGMKVHIVLVILLLGCSKIGSFHDPYFQESFTGELAIIPSNSDKEIRTFSHLVTVVGNGESISLYGITGPLPNLSLEDKGAVSGLVGVPVDGGKVQITGFMSADKEAEDYMASAKGTVLLDQEQKLLYTDPEDPIVITVRSSKEANSGETIVVKTLTFLGRQVPRVSTL